MNLVAGLTLFRIDQLVDHDIPDIDFLVHELLHQSLSLVHREELRDAHRHEGCFGLEITRSHLPGPASGS